MEHECWNTAPHGAQDDGCDPETPICVGPGGKEIDDACYGEACVTCVNSEQADTVADYGCSDETPMCLLEEDGDAPPLSKPGNFCQGPSGDVCINDKVNGAKDENCKDNKPLCVKHDGSVAWLHTQGDKCVRCVNTFLYNSAHMVDEGCGPSAPCCVESYGGSAPAVGYAGAACMANAD